MARGGMEMLCSMLVPKRGETTEKAERAVQWAHTVISAASICAGQPENTFIHCPAHDWSGMATIETKRAVGGL